MHKLKEINITDKTAICQVCGNVSIKLKNKGNNKFRWACRNWLREGYKPHWHRKQSYRSMISSSCKHCGFIPKHICQLDIHHIDHNHNNNEPTNLMTLCANCHRLDRVGLLF